MWQKRFSAFCFPLEGGVAARHDPGPLTRWPYCLTQTLVVVLGRKRYLGASGGGVFTVTSLGFYRDLQKKPVRRAKENKLHHFQGGRKANKEVDELVWFIFERNLLAKYSSWQSLIFKLFRSTPCRCLALIYVKVKAPLNK